MSPSIAIIGAGMGGLSAALELSARPGFDVTLLEAADGPGGKVGIAEYDGISFDTGPSLLTLPGVLCELFGGRGHRLADELELIRPEPAGRYHFPDGTSFDVGPTATATEANIDLALGPIAASEFREFMVYAKRIWDAAAPNFVLGPAPTVLSAVSLGFTKMRELFAIDSRRTMIDAIDSRITDRRLRALFLRYATFNGSDPRQAPATLNCISWVDLGLGAWGVRGGMFEIARAMERLAKKGGVHFKYNAPVTSIARDGDGVVVEWMGGSMRADAVVVNTDVRHFADDLWSGESCRRLNTDATPSTSGWTAVIKARRRSANRRPAHTVIFPERDYLREFVDLFDHRRMPEQPTIYLCAREKAHHCVGWKDHEPLFVMINAPPHDGENRDSRQSDIEALVMTRLRALEHIDGDDEIIWRRTNGELAARFPGSHGSLYGAASNNRLAAFQRPPNRVPGLSGVYLASGSAHPGGGVPLCIQSGRQAAAELLEDIQR